MKYFMNFEQEKLVSISTEYGEIEITKDEYVKLQSDFKEKSKMVSLVFSGEKDINDVPMEWQEDVQSQVNYMHSLMQDEAVEATDTQVREAVETLL